MTSTGLRTFTDRVDYVDVSKGEGVAAKVTEFLDRKPADKPFFLWVNFNDPHHPWNELTDSGPPRPRSSCPRTGPICRACASRLAGYCGEVNRLDLQVKAVLDVLGRARAAGQHADRVLRRQRRGAARTAKARFTIPA